MSIDKNFVVKHGLEVNSDLILADSNTKRVGIATTVPGYTLDVAGGIGVTNLSVTGIGSIVDLHVGTDGEVFRAIGAAGSVGVGTAFPSYLLDVRTSSDSGTTALYVRGDVQVTGDLSIDDLSVNQVTTDHIFVGTAATAVNLYVPTSGIATIGVGIVTEISGTLLDYTGIGTISTFNSGIGTITNLVSTSSTLTNFVSTYSTITSLDIENLVGSYATITTAIGTSFTVENITGTSSTLTNIVSTSSTVVSLDVTNLVGSSSSLSNIIVSGISTFIGTTVIGTSFVTGTDSQFFQVSGDSYISGNLGVGKTIPSYRIDVDGDINVTGDFRINGSPLTGVNSVSYARTSFGLEGTPSIVVGVATADQYFTTGIITASGANINNNVTLNSDGIFVNSGIVTAGGISLGAGGLVYDSINGLYVSGASRVVGVFTATTSVNTGIITATSSVFGSNVTSNASGITISSGILTAPTAVVGSNVTANSSGINVSGIVTATTIRGTTIVAGSNVTSNASGITISSGILTAPTAVVGSNVTMNSTGINVSGIVTATEFRGRSGFSVAMSLIFGY